MARPSKTRVQVANWCEGDIAFLPSAKTFSAADYHNLIDSRYIPEKATGHPVIVLKVLSDSKVLVTPVSSYSAAANNNLPPWKQVFHRFKRGVDFRSFEGSPKYNDRHPSLHLEGDKKMPKPTTSWVYIQSAWEVPKKLLGFFDKAREILRVRQDSLEDLQRHIAMYCKTYNAAWALADVAPRPAPLARRTGGAPTPGCKRTPAR